MTRLAIVAAADDAALHGLDGTFGWGEARTVAPEAPAAADVVLELGPGGIVVRGPGHRIATAGDGLWRRAPLPANDALSALPPGDGVLVIGPADALREHGVQVTQAERLTAAGLAAAAIVAFAGEPGAPLPAAAPAVLAAGRLLIVPRADPGFGLLAGVDHLAYDSDYELAQLADAAATFPLAFETIVAMGRLAARAQLASAVYGRLSVDLALSASA